MKRFVSAMFVACTVSVAVGVAAQVDPATQSPRPAIAGQQPAAGAQEPATGVGPASPREQRPAASQRPTQEKVTISGCIQNAPAAAASGAAAGAESTKFVLANAKAAGAGASGSAVGTSGTTATRYRLEGEEKTISPHLNHQVEITGTVQNSSASAAGAAPGSAAAGPMLKVDSVKMVSATCSS